MPPDPLTSKPLRLLFLGTPEFAVPTVRALFESRHELVGVVSQPDRPRGRGRKLAPTPTKVLAEELGVPVFQPEKVGDAEAVEWMRAIEPDIAVVVAFGQFIPKKVRELPRLEMINGHASLLPRWRGAAPIEWAIAGGDTHTGVSVMRVVREMDAGSVCLTREVEIGENETGGELTDRLSILAADGLVAAIEQITAGEAAWVDQDESGVTEAPKLDREFAQLDWSWPVDAVLRRIRAATPRPGVNVTLAESGKTLRILVCRKAKPEGPPAPTPGAVLASDDGLLIGALDGWVAVLRLQVQGRRPVDAAEFFRGARVSPGETVLVLETQ